MRDTQSIAFLSVSREGIVVLRRGDHEAVSGFDPPGQLPGTAGESRRLQVGIVKRHVELMEVGQVHFPARIPRQGHGQL